MVGEIISGLYTAKKVPGCAEYGGPAEDDRAEDGEPDR